MQDIETLLNLLHTGKISGTKFLQKCFSGNIPNKEDILDLIEQAIEVKNALMIEEAIASINILYFKGAFSYVPFVEKLCQLLHLSWHFKHEDIAMMLRDAKDPSSVNCLYNAAELQFEYLAYDDTYQFARKCIKALSAISDDNALEKLKLLTKSDTQLISEYAKKELNYKG